MKTLRIPGALLLVLLVAVSLSACAKQEQQQVSMQDSTYAVENPATVEEVPPAEPEPSAGASKPRTTKKTYTSTTPAASERRTVSLPAGTTFDVEMVTEVHSGKSNVGDRIEARLLQPLTSSNGTVIAERGAAIRGEIADLKRASRTKSAEERASVKLAFTSIETVDGEKTLDATVTNSEGRMVAKSTTKRDALVIGGSTVAGAVIGKVLGKDTKGAIIGAVGGAVLGTGYVMSAKGHEIEISPGSKVTLRADAPVTVVAR